jgi:alcohol dehydrogenase class IV
MTISDRPIELAPYSATSCMPGISAELGARVQPLGRRAFIVADPGVVAAGLVGPLEQSLADAGVEFEVFSGVEPNPTDANVAEGVEALRAFGDAVVVLVGGGSAMDCGKAIAMTAPNDGTVLDYAFAPTLDENDAIDLASLLGATVPENEPHATVAVPTTSGTASETNGGGLITDTADDRKLTFNHDGVKPQSVLLDPALTVGLPPVPTATCGMDALTHSIEALTSTQHNPYADGLALQAVRTVGAWLPRVMDEPTDLEGRTQMMLAAHLAGRAFSAGPLLGLVHASGHPLSAVLHQAHGQTLASMLPHVMRFNLEVVADRYALVGQALGVEADAEAAIAAVQALSATVGTDKTLSELGATSDHVPTLTEQALTDLMIMNTPRYPTRAEVTELYHAAL